MNLKEKIRKIKDKASLKKALLKRFDMDQIFKYVANLEKMFKEGDIDGLLKVIQPIIESEGYTMKVKKKDEYYIPKWDFVVLIKKKEEVA